MRKYQKIGLPAALLIAASCVVWLWLGKSIFYDSEREHLQQFQIHAIPENICFADEEVHFKTPTSYQLFYREIRLNDMNARQYKVLNKQVKYILPTIEQILKKQQIPDDFKYIAIAESHLRNDVRSSQGAAGVWQLTKPTAISLGLKVDDTVDERLNIIKSTKAACKLIRLAHDKFGNWTSAAAAYNRGMGGLERAMIKQGEDSYYDLDLNSETARYIYKILAFKKLLDQPIGKGK